MAMVYGIQWWQRDTEAELTVKLTGARRAAAEMEVGMAAAAMGAGRAMAGMNAVRAGGGGTEASWSSLQHESTTLHTLATTGSTYRTLSRQR